MIISKCIRCTVIQNLLALTLLSLALQGLAQSSNQPAVSNTKNNDQPSSCFEYVVQVKVEVRDQQGREIADLTKDDFMIYEDGVKQEIFYWKRKVGPDKEADHTMYEVGYFPTNGQLRGEWRKIRVEVRNQEKKKLKVQYTPKGYYAKEGLRK